MAFNEALYKRGTGAQGGQFVSKDGTKSNAIGYDGARGSGYGSKGGDPNVKALQKALNKLGITDAQGKPLAVDGKFGPRTTAAVRRLQRKLGLPVDGKVTPALLKRIQGLKKKTTLTDASTPKKATAKKAAPSRKAAPAGKTPPPARTVRPIGRSVGYSSGMTDIDRHGTHNQKSHGNRLGRPTNVGGKTGLAKATAALADKPDQAPESIADGQARLDRERAQRISDEIREEMVSKTPKLFSTLLGNITVKAQRDAVQAMRDGGWKFVDQIIGTYVVEAPDGTQVRLFQQKNGTLGFSEVGTGRKLTPQSVSKMAKAQGPAPAAKPRNLDTSAKRKAAVEEHNKLTKSQFDALPEGEKERIIAELQQVVKDSEYDTATGRGSYGMRYRGQAEHRSQAQFMLANFRRPTAPVVDNSVGGRAARLKSATSANEARSILHSATVKDMDAIAEANGWLGGTSRGWKKDKWIAHLVNKAMAGKA